MADNNIDYLHDAKVADNKYAIDYKCKYCRDTGEYYIMGLKQKCLNCFPPDIAKPKTQPYYHSGTYETINVIEAWGLNFSLGNVIKYVARAGRKTDNPIDDLEKAKWYIEREIEKLKQK